MEGASSLIKLIFVEVALIHPSSIKLHAVAVCLAQNHNIV